MLRIRRFRKMLACFFLVLLGGEIFTPASVYALTSGPSQPEMKGFEAAGTADMVDLFTGDFTYNIPLLDVGGYPINMSYHSGTGMDDEASWVGLGWSLNPGVMNRQVRGLPDDFNGDEITRDFNMRGDTTYGLNATVKGEFVGLNLLSGGLSANVGVFKNNYRGIGAEFGINPGIKMGLGSSGSLTANLNMNSNSQSGVDVTPSVTLSMTSDNIMNTEANASLSIGFPYNSRAGLKGMTLSESWGIKQKTNARSSLGMGGDRSSYIDFASEPVSPTISMPWNSSKFTFSTDLNFAFSLFEVGGGISGYHGTRNLATKQRKLGGYGFMYAENGKDDPYALMDFNREKDQPFYPTTPYLAMPVITNDIFVASSQEGSRQFRPFKGSSGIFFDHKTENGNGVASVGVELGFGPGAFQVGADLYKQEIREETGKWTEGNPYMKVGDFKGYDSLHPAYEATYFKQSGEKTAAAADFDNAIGGTQPVAVNLNTFPNDAFAIREFVTKGKKQTVNDLNRSKRDKRNQVMSFLNAREASNSALDKYMLNYPMNTLVLPGCTSPSGTVQKIYRGLHAPKRHHMSEITVTAEDGKRMIYGIPAYNRKQEEVSFSVDARRSGLAANQQSGLVKYNNTTDNKILNKNGKDWYYSKESTPGYAHSYLLSAILSPDYVDLTGNGITEDDLGTAVKFNYTRLRTDYRWRTPYAKDSANYNENHISDPEDDKANYVYGEKEIWYLHSIESKTMVAQFILDTDRKDGLGVLNEDGGMDASKKLASLKEIRLYSRADLLKSPAYAKPVKTVHFRYNYSLCEGSPNSIADNKGKLTLDSLYYTFGENTRGIQNPYVFGYDIRATNFYQLRQYDRWGTFKDRASNSNGLTNSEYPYSVRDTATANKNASLWQLNQIKLPTGGQINVAYESDDYAWVQDKRAMQMCFIKGVGSVGNGNNIMNTDKFYVTLPHPVQTDAELRQRYFEGIKKLYGKFYVDLDNRGHYEYVPGYLDLSDAVIKRIDANTAEIKVSKYLNKYNPVSKMAWQMLRLDLPRYAYPSYDNSNSTSSNATTAIRSLVSAFGQIEELWQSFDKTADKKRFGNKIDLSKSFVRLNTPNYKKLGGGSRVKEVRMYDQWKSMTEVAAATTAYYGQEYSYTTTQTMANGETAEVSSGVASYEPMVGNDENPFRQPVDYSQRIPLGLTNFFFMEEPVGESYFPNPVVGYSKVKVRQLEQDKRYVRTGWSENEFYTARDFPTLVEQVKLPVQRFGTKNILGVMRVKINNSMAVSQGYVVRVNDMHGKPRSSADFDKAGKMMASAQYHYRTENPDAPVKKLRNVVPLLSPDNTVSDGIVGRDMEMFTDMRQQLSANSHISVKASVGGQIYIFFALGFGFPGIGPNEDIKLFRSSSSIKLITEYGILDKVVKIQDGSTISTQNMLWDGETGDVLLTSVQNEFGDPVYNFSYPAHWAYEGMGQAYKNTGLLFKGFRSTSSGQIITPQHANDYYVTGDELVDISTGTRGWIVESGLPGKPLRIIDRTGRYLQVTGRNMLVVRSGRRNMPGAGIGMLASLKNPVQHGRLDVSVATQILETKNNTFKDEWPVLVKSRLVPDSTGWCINNQDLTYFFRSMMVNYATPARKAFYATPNNDVMIGELMRPAGGSYEYSANALAQLEGKYDIPYYLYSQRVARNGLYLRDFYLQAGDSAQLGESKIFFDTVGVDFNKFVNRKNLTLDSLSKFVVWQEGSLELDGNCYYRLMQDTSTGSPEARMSQLQVSYPTNYITHLVFHIKNPPRMSMVCNNTMNLLINPYAIGLKGNWRSDAQYAYHGNRKVIISNTAIKGSTNIRKAGYYETYTPFWNHANGKFNPIVENVNWVKAAEIMLYGAKGEELENRDAIGQYSAAQFGYMESLPVAVASNARFRQIGFDGFEDYNFLLDCAADTCNNGGHFNFKRPLMGLATAKLDETVSHTGNYSLAVNSGTAVSMLKVNYTEPSPLYTFDPIGRYLLGNNNMRAGFVPTAGKYVLSAWVKDGNTSTRTTTAQISVNGSNLINGAVNWPMVEGWKRVEVVFTIPDGNFNLSLLANGGKTWFDDIRIYPYNGQFKSFVYDERTQMLMAELDENNFATFYEYDDENILVRVKKETERGIMTIKETRSRYRTQ